MNADVVFRDHMIVITMPFDERLTRLVKAATNVCDVRYSDAEWGALNEAIDELIGELIALGVDFHNPRIS